MESKLVCVRVRQEPLGVLRRLITSRVWSNSWRPKELATHLLPLSFNIIHGSFCEFLEKHWEKISSWVIWELKRFWKVSWNPFFILVVTTMWRKKINGFCFFGLLPKNLCDKLKAAPQIFSSRAELVDDITSLWGHLCTEKTKWLFKEDHF